LAIGEVGDKTGGDRPREHCIVITSTGNRRCLSSFSSSLSIYILIFFSETTELIGTKLVRNGHWMVSYKVFFVDQKYTKETRGPKISKRVCAYIWVYIVYMFLMNFFLMHSLRKSPLETCITILCNYYYF
jgi:hypothetical protein